jgi:hypothetical protein
MQNFLQLCEIGIHKDCPDAEVEACVVHELLHICTNKLRQVAGEYAGALGNPSTGPVLLNAVHEADERLIEQLVEALIGRRPMMFGKSLKHFQMFAA